jgi:hypothetical protein
MTRGGLVSSLFPAETVERLVRDHLEGSRDQSPRLWKLLALEAWHTAHGGSL